MWPHLAAGRGTYYYDGAPKLFDQFLASRGLLISSARAPTSDSPHLRACLESVAVDTSPSTSASPSRRATRPGLMQPARPRRFGRPSQPKTYDPEGTSDHFPITMELEVVD
jgi:hypothetical protein